MRQYIGARYVPKFDGDWDNTKAYEALIIVSYNNSWYTSKKPVPVGTAITNEEYWVLTGNTNGAIIDLNEQTAAIRDRLDDVDDEIESINDTMVTKLKKVLFIGDSYATGTGGGLTTNPWVNIVASKLNLTSEDWWKFARGGESFGINNGAESDPVTGYNFCDRLREAINTLTEAERLSIDHIIVGGGLNDYAYTAANVDTGMYTFYQMKNQYFPNAEVIVATFGGGLVPTYKYAYFTTTLPAYFNSCATYKFRYLDCFGDLYRQKSYFHSDGVHLTQEGESAIGLELFEKLVYGDHKYVERRYEITGQFIGITSWDGKQYHLYPTATEINFPSPVTLSSTWVKVGTANTAQLNGGTSSTAQQFNIPCMVLCGGVMYNSVNLTFQFRHIDDDYSKVEVWVRQVGYWEGQGFKSFADVSRIYLSAQYVELSAMNM